MGPRRPRPAPTTRINAASRVAARVVRTWLVPGVLCCQAALAAAVELRSAPAAGGGQPAADGRHGRLRRQGDGGPAAASTVLTSVGGRRASDTGPLDAIKERLERAKERTGKAVESVREKVKRPLMNAINKIRTNMCWDRPHLWDHKECLKFLGVNCAKRSTGDGVCKAFFETIKEHCTVELNSLEKSVCKYLEHKLGKRYPIQEKQEKAKDSDGDGVVDSKDPFPNDDKEWADLNKDGIGDNAAAPSAAPAPAPSAAAEEFHDLDQDGTPDELDTDVDGDGVENKEDQAPRDPSLGAADAGSASTTTEEAGGSSPETTTEAAAGAYVDDVAHRMNKVERPLPEHGFDELSGVHVEHDDMKTATHDWRGEWPQSSETRRATLERICAADPDNEWCARYGYSL